MTAATSPASEALDLSRKLTSEALKNLYREYPELDPGKFPDFSACSSADDIMAIADRQKASSKTRRSNGWDKIRKNLKPVVEIAIRLAGVLGESGDVMVSPCFSRIYCRVSMDSAGSPGRKGCICCIWSLALGRSLSGLWFRFDNEHLSAAGHPAAERKI